jgi:hypothetical protein
MLEEVEMPPGHTPAASRPGSGTSAGVAGRHLPTGDVRISVLGDGPPPAHLIALGGYGEVQAVCDRASCHETPCQETPPSGRATTIAEPA